jgi:hypothetical protein
MSNQRPGSVGDPQVEGTTAPVTAGDSSSSASTPAPTRDLRPDATTPSIGASISPSGPVSPTAPTLGQTASSPTGARRPRISQELTSGAIIAERYQVVERLSAGGMGVVYKARHIALDDMVALKLLLKPQKEEDQKRFLQEARVATKIKHPNTVYVSDFGVLPDGRSYLAMEFLRGKTLAQAIHESTTTAVSTGATTKPASPSVLAAAVQASVSATPNSTNPAPVGDSGMDPLRVCRIGLQIARGLHAVHEKGIVHRGPFQNQKPSRNRDLIRAEKTAGKLGKIRGLGLVLDGSEQSRAFNGAHCA